MTKYEVRMEMDEQGIMREKSYINGRLYKGKDPLKESKLKSMGVSARESIESLAEVLAKNSAVFRVSAKLESY